VVIASAPTQYAVSATLVRSSRRLPLSRSRNRTSDPPRSVSATPLRTDGTPYPPEELALARAVRRGETVEGEEWMVSPTPRHAERRTLERSEA
jgi:hypothetical protein